MILLDNGSNIAIGYESLRFNDAKGLTTLLSVTQHYTVTVVVISMWVLVMMLLLGNTTGLRNVGVGSDSLSNNQTGNDNVALGFEAGTRY